MFNYCHSNLYLFKTLREFQYIDDNAADVGMNVRTEAKEITRLLVNPEALKRGRTSNRRSNEEYESSPQRRRSSEEEDAGRRPQQQPREKRQTAEEKDLARAIEMSKQEEERRLRAVEKSNGGGIFNDLEE